MEQKKRLATNYSIAEAENHFPFIDGLRGIAILMVVMVHTALNTRLSEADIYRSDTFYAFLNAGARGVQLFFIISAFTLYNSSLQRFAADPYPKTGFYLRRAFRILPLWWLMVFLYAYLNGNSVRHITANIFFYFGFIRFIPNYDIVPGSWSLFAEEMFYLFLPFFFLRIRTLYGAFKFLVVCYLIKVFWMLFTERFHIPVANDYTFLFPLNHWLFFSIGIFLYFLLRADFYRNAVKNRSFLIALDIVTVISIWEMLRESLTLAAVPVTLLFLSAASDTPIIGKITRTRLLMRYGGYCYSIYLFHFAILRLALPLRAYLFNTHVLSKLPPDIRFLVYFPLIAALCLVAGFVSFNLIEKPCVKLGKRLIGIMQKPTQFKPMPEISA